MAIRVVLEDASHRLYLMKVERRELGVYCFVPKLGAHLSRHQSGESHFSNEGKSIAPVDQPPVVMMGPAGLIDLGATHSTAIADLGVASRICTAIFQIQSISEDFQRFTRSTSDCFVVRTSSLAKSTTALEIEVWAVPARNMVSFEWQHRDIPPHMLHKAAESEPQLWIYARPAQP